MAGERKRTEWDSGGAEYTKGFQGGASATLVDTGGHREVPTILGKNIAKGMPCRIQKDLEGLRPREITREDQRIP